MAFTLPDLPFAADSLSSKGMSAETFEYHHGKHHAGYVAKLNKAIEGTAHAEKDLEEIIKAADGGLFNNAAQHWNHSFFWNCLTPDAKEGPSGPLMDAIEAKWGTLEQFKGEFGDKAKTLFGSGWAFLVKKPDGSLEIAQEANAGCPVKTGGHAILTLDVWEHAYYIDHRNARPDFVDQFWSMANWDFAEENYAG